MDLYQSLVTVNPVTLIAQICNLFIQLLIVKIFFLDKIKGVLDKRRETADKQIADAEAAKSEAAAIKQTYEENMRQAKTKADDMILSAQKTAPPFAFAKQRGKRFACAPGGVAPASAIQRANSRKVHQYQPPHSEARRHRIQ